MVAGLGSLNSYRGRPARPFFGAGEELGQRPAVQEGQALTKSHAGWRSRGYLPHFDSPEIVQHIVFRLADALSPATKAELRSLPPAERNTRVLDALRQGHGARLLSDPAIAGIVEDALLHFDGERYRLLAWCIMPSHVHVLLEQVEGFALSTVVQSWKSFTAKAANDALGRSGSFWANEYYDRFMRNEAHLETTRAYIINNPVVAGLCASPEDWRYSSAWNGRS
jgi:putative DNA methylase